MAEAVGRTQQQHRQRQRLKQQSPQSESESRVTSQAQSRKSRGRAAGFGCACIVINFIGTHLLLLALSHLGDLANLVADAFVVTIIDSHFTFSYCGA